MHEMHLNHEPFLAIKNGTKTIELRLLDEKRRNVQYFMAHFEQAKNVL